MAPTTEILSCQDLVVIDDTQLFRVGMGWVGSD